MHLRARLLAAAAALVLSSAIGAAKADDKTPRDQGLNSVDKNLARDPDNRGLTNAQQRIEDNAADRKERRAAKGDRDDKTGHKDKDKDKDKPRHANDDRNMRTEKAARPEKADRPDRPERAGRS